MRRKRRFAPTAAPTSTSVLQRTCACGQHTPAGGTCQSCAGGNAPVAEHAQSAVDRALTSPGRPLEAPARLDMESRFGRDFSRVRLHTDGAAAESARAVDASAYTVGQDVVFGAGRYEPATSSGRRLLAHELAHTVQQGDGAAARGPLTLAPPGGAAEREAQAAADGVTTGGATGASATIARSATGVLQRAPAPAPAAPTPAKKAPTPTETVEEAIADFALFTTQWADAAMGLTVTEDATFSGTISYLNTRLVDAEGLIDGKLSGGPALRKRLREAYATLIHTMMPVAARGLKIAESDLYRRNSGRIPMWAWPTVHHLETDISTPLPPDAVVDPSPAAGGKAVYAAGSFEVTVLPDAFNVAKHGSGAETTINFDWGSYAFGSTTTAGTTRITSLTVPGPPKAVIQTEYGSDASPIKPSGYGRGTTAEDIAGGPEKTSTTLGFHEGTHGLDFEAWMRGTQPPVFGGAIGQTKTAFDVAVAAWKAACKKYAKDMQEDSVKRTDCVGTTKDTYKRAKAAPGAVIKLVCKPKPKPKR